LAIGVMRVHQVIGRKALRSSLQGLLVLDQQVDQPLFEWSPARLAPLQVPIVS
jgi:hypothetical protein